MRIYAETYGCTMNKGDTELMLGSLENEGHEIVEDIEESDLVILNTCAVIRTTLNKMISRLRDLQEKNKKTIVAGCLPLIDHEKIEQIGEFAGVISCRTTDSINEIVRKIEEGEEGIEKIRPKGDKLTESRHRDRKSISSPVPIAEGCVSNCSYCCVKFARGDLKSYSPERIIEEVKQELSAGRNEIYITTQDTAAYGLDIGTNLASLLNKISSIRQNFRVRVGMMNPAQAKPITPELIKAFDNEKIYKFLHLPVQSGNDKILNKMRRKYNVEDFKEITHSFREKFEDLYLSTDIIVGFPEETEEAFEDSCQLMRDIKPDKINITRFTPMPGTDAEKMDQIDSEEKKRRSKIMTNVFNEVRQGKNRNLVGSEKTALVIKKGKKGGYMARLDNYKPVIVGNAKPGQFIEVKIMEAEPAYLKGEILEVKN